jgi:ATP-dependent exoDNAse (exonuclease V) beta subunit
MNGGSSASRPGAPVNPERTEQQRTAVAEPGRDVFLRAGAGTGKTTVLVDRFCAAALDPEVGVEGVLAFTFTERAADQLRRRIRVALPGMEEKVDRAWISTIHGFCRRLLATHPAAAGLDPGFRVIDEAEGDRLAEYAFAEALDSLVGEGDPAALELAASNRMLLGMTRSAYDELRSQGNPTPELPDPPPADVAARISALVDAAESARRACEEADSDKGLANLERLGRAAHLEPSTGLGFELLEELGELRLEGGGKQFEGDECDRYKAALERAREAVAGVVMKEAYEQLRELVRRFGTRYEELKGARSALDFEDLQLQAVALLRGNERLRERYRSQFRALLVDEFQDTNALQLGLVSQLRGPDTRLFCVGDEFQSIYGFRHADVDVYRRQHRRFAEGDEPNGVALPLTGNFRAASEVLAATNAIGAAILPGFEALSSGLDEAGSSDDPLAELVLVADDKKGWGAAEVGLKPLPDDPSSPSKLAEARALAARLRELVDAGEDPSEIVILLRAFTHASAIERALREAGLDPYVVGGRGFWSQQQIEDMRAVLAVIANPLSDEPLFGVLASPAGGAVLPDTLWLLRKAATEPAEDDGARPRLLHIWPVLEELADAGDDGVGPADGPLAEIPAEERERLRTFTERLRKLRARGAEGGLESLVERAATAFGYDLAVLMRDSGSQRWANVRKLMRLAREFEAREGPNLRGLIAYLDSRAASRDREAEAATRAEGHAGVRVMTVHAAKGLEFGVVAVADLGRSLHLGWMPLRVEAGADRPDEGETARVGVQLGRLGRPAARLHDYQELTERATDRGAEEEARLAYVAATRAKRRLILSGTFTKRALTKEPASRQPVAAQLVRALLGGEPADGVVELEPAAEGAPAGRLKVRVLRPQPGLGAELAPPDAPAAAPPPTGAIDPPLRRDPVPPALAGGLSYSALSAYERCGYRFYVERMLGVAGPDHLAAVDPAAVFVAADGEGEGDEDSAAPTARQRFGPGVAVHSLLEWSARHGWREPAEERVAAALRDEGLEPDRNSTRQAGALVSAWLHSPLLAELADARVNAEVPFVLPVGGALVRGSIDLLAQRRDGSILVVDYKSDHLDGADPAAIADRYDVQRDLYALAAASRGERIETAYVFLERADAPVRAGFDSAALDAARVRIEAVLGRLAAGEFAVTEHPHRALCHDCPARERLCSHTAAAQMRDAPEPAIMPVPRSNREGEPAAPPSSEPVAAPSDDHSQLTLLD